MENGSERERLISLAFASNARGGRRFMIRESKNDSISSSDSSLSRVSIDTSAGSIFPSAPISELKNSNLVDPASSLQLQTHPMDIIEKLPVEISLYIFSFLEEEKDLLNLAKVSSYWNKLAYDGRVWQGAFQKYEGKGWKTMEDVEILWKKLYELLRSNDRESQSSSKVIFNQPQGMSNRCPIGGQINERIGREIRERGAIGPPLKEFQDSLKDSFYRKDEISMEFDLERISESIDWYTLCKARHSLQTIWGLRSKDRDIPIGIREAETFGLLHGLSVHGIESLDEEIQALPSFQATAIHAEEYRHIRKFEREEGYMPETKFLKGHEDSVYCIRLDNKPFELPIAVKADLQEAYERSPLYNKECSLGIGSRGKIFSGSRDRTIKIWDSDSGLCLHTLKGHTGSVLCLAFDQDILLSGSSDSSVIVWDLKPMSKGEEPKMLKRIKSHTAGVLDLSLTEQYVMSCGKDAVVRVYDRSNDFEIIGTYCGHPGPVNAGCISLFNGALHAVTASGEGSIHLWVLTSGELIRTFTGHTKGLACVKFVGNTVLSGSNDYTIRLWNATTGQCLARCDEHTDLVRAVAYDDKRKIIVSAGYDGRVKIFDVQRHVLPSSQHVEGGNLIGSLTDLPPFKHHSRTVRVFDVEMDGTRILSSGETNNICIRDFTNSNPIMRLFA